MSRLRNALAPLLTATLPGCTFVGTGIGFAAASGVPGPYESKTFSSPGKTSPQQTLQTHDVEDGDFVELTLKTGRKVEGTYRGVVGPTATDPESYVVIEQGSTTRLAAPAPSQKGKAMELVRVPASDVSSLGVDVIGYGWVIGTVLGLVIDVLVIRAAMGSVHVVGGS